MKTPWKENSSPIPAPAIKEAEIEPPYAKSVAQLLSFSSFTTDHIKQLLNNTNGTINATTNSPRTFKPDTLLKNVQEVAPPMANPSHVNTTYRQSAKLSSKYQSQIQHEKYTFANSPNVATNRATKNSVIHRFYPNVLFPWALRCTSSFVISSARVLRTTSSW